MGVNSHSVDVDAEPPLDVCEFARCDAPPVGDYSDEFCGAAFIRR